MIDLNDDGEAIDVLTVNNRLEMNNQLDDVGGVAYIAELASSVPTAANVGYYAKLVGKFLCLSLDLPSVTGIGSTNIFGRHSYCADRLKLLRKSYCMFYVFISDDGK